MSLQYQSPEYEKPVYQPRNPVPSRSFREPGTSTQPQNQREAGMASANKKMEEKNKQLKAERQQLLSNIEGLKSQRQQLLGEIHRMKSIKEELEEGQAAFDAISEKAINLLSQVDAAEAGMAATLTLCLQLWLKIPTRPATSAQAPAKTRQVPDYIRNRHLPQEDWTIADERNALGMTPPGVSYSLATRAGHPGRR